VLTIAGRIVVNSLYKKEKTGAETGSYWPPLFEILFIFEVTKLIIRFL